MLYKLAGSFSVQNMAELANPLTFKLITVKVSKTRRALFAVQACWFLLPVGFAGPYQRLPVYINLVRNT
jgi:hypothetical protein